MLGFKFISVLDYNMLLDKAARFDSKVNEHIETSHSYRDQQDLIMRVRDWLLKQGAVVVSVEHNCDQEVVFVCAKDERHLEVGGDGKPYFAGDFLLFCVSAEILPSVQRPLKFREYPHLEATFYSGHVEIDELHCDMADERFLRRGYGTLLVQELIRFAKKADCTSVSGILSEQDAKTEEEKTRRNSFYFANGFSLKFDKVSDGKRGTIFKDLSQIKA